MIEARESQNQLVEKFAFFGCDLDCDERHEALQEKLSWGGHPEEVTDPYEEVLSRLRRESDPNLWLEKGKVEVPNWLRPTPAPSEKDQLTAEGMVRFLDDDGCRDLAARVGVFVQDQVFPHRPALIAVDHSLAGGVYRAVAERCAPAEVALVVLDSHTDAIPMSILGPAVQYDAETNPESVHDPEDPLIHNRPDSYNASSFLYHLLVERILQPRNLYILGVGDYPPKRAFRLKDERIRNYVDFYPGLKQAGVNLMTKEELTGSPSRVRRLLEGIRTPYLYLSVDMDIGAGNALEGVRFLDRTGLNEPQLFRVIETLADVLTNKVQLAGLDLAEFNPRRAGRDSTYPIAAEIVKKIISI